MAMLSVTINSTQYDFEVSTEDASQEQSEYIGDVERAFDGSLRSSRRGAKRQWRFTVISDGHLMTQSEHDAFRTAVEGGAGIGSCTGAALSNATIDCLISILEAPYLATHLTHARMLALQLQEV